MKPHGWSEITWWSWGIWSKVCQNIVGSMYIIRRSLRSATPNQFVENPSPRRHENSPNVQRPSNWSHGRSNPSASTKPANWLTPTNSSVKTARYYFFNTPLATSRFRKHLISIKFSHEHTETEPNIYDLWIKQINLQYNARSNKPCIQFQHKPIFLRKVHQGADFAEIPDRSFTLFVPMIEEPVFFLSREQLSDVGSVCLRYS